MFENIWIFLENTLKTNAFAQGGLLLGIMTGLIVWLKKAPAWIWGRLENQLYTSIEVDNRNNLFFWVNSWLAQHSYSSKSRKLFAETYFISAQDRKAVGFNDDFNQAIRLEPSYGWHWFVHNRIFVLFFRERVKQEGGSSTKDPLETYKFRFFTRNREKVQKVLTEIREVKVKEDRTNPSLYRYRGKSGYWDRVKVLPDCKYDSTILREGLKEELAQDLEIFYNSAEIYIERKEYHTEELIYTMD